MQPGKLRHIVTIEYQQESQSPETGAITVVWLPVSGCQRIHAEVLPDRASEFFSTRQIQSTTNAMIRLRWRAGITAKMRVRHHLRDRAPALEEIWDIQGSVHFQDRFRELRLMCLYREAEGFRSDGWLEPAAPPGSDLTVDSDQITVDSDEITVDQVTL